MSIYNPKQNHRESRIETIAKKLHRKNTTHQTRQQLKKHDKHIFDIKPEFKEIVIYETKKDKLKDTVGDKNNISSRKLKSGKKYTLEHIEQTLPDKYLRIDNTDKNVLDKIIPNTYIRYVTHDGVYRYGHLKHACWKTDRQGDMCFFWMMSKGFNPFPWRIKPLTCRAIYVMRKVEDPLYAYTYESLNGSTRSIQNVCEPSPKTLIPQDRQESKLVILYRNSPEYVKNAFMMFNALKTGERVSLSKKNHETIKHDLKKLEKLQKENMQLTTQNKELLREIDHLRTQNEYLKHTIIKKYNIR